MDSAYIDYEKLETLTQREVMYVTKMKKDLKYNIIEDCMHQTYEGLIEVHIQNVTFSKTLKDGTILTHYARIITYVDTKNIAYKRYRIWSKRNYRNLPQTLGDRNASQVDIKQNFPLKYFYGESANAI